jgi:YYY domain-containing protein
MSSVTNIRLRRLWLYDILFLLVLALAGYLRLTGVNWGEAQHQHPDENFLSGVLASLQAHKCADATIPVEVCPAEQKQWIGIGDYFNSQTSTLNPYNRGYSFFVYGNLPMTLVRVAVDALRQPDAKILGRQFSALADLFAILLLYFIVSRMYGGRVGLLASLFSALTVMQIQQSHFFTTDLFVNAFAFLALWFAVAILEYEEQRSGISKTDIIEQGIENEELSEISADNSKPPLDGPRFRDPPSPITNTLPLVFRNPLFLLSIGFGFAFGMAMASKINIVPLAILLPAAFMLRYIVKKDQGDTHSEESASATEDNRSSNLLSSLQTDYWMLVMVCLVAGGLAALISFRIFQPYAFSGLGLNPQWVANIREQRVQAAGGADLPWELQWARRTHLYSFTNLTLWGLGLPLGILAWAGFLLMGWRILKGEWRHALLWGWTAIYFIWQSLQFNPTMRYQLPIYPLLAMMAAWFVFELAHSNVQAFKRLNFSRILAGVVGISVVVLTAMWAFAFHSIYTRDEPRIAASRWIYQNVPGPINVQIQTSDSTYNQLVPFQPGGYIRAGQPYDTTFTAQRDGIVESITLEHAISNLASTSVIHLILSDTPNPTPGRALAAVSLTADFSSNNDPRGDSHSLVLDNPVQITKGNQYYLRFEIDSGALFISGASISNETDYDYGLPFRLDGYDAFGGIYRGLNLQVYWDDNADKLENFVTTLDQTDYIFIPTNHQYAQITRLPERYPLTTLYYRELIGCPADQDIIRCYHEAKPGDYQGTLGFDLVAVFETFPKLGPIVINDQWAEEAFTFYDHPKVLIFKKNSDFNATQVRSTLSTVDLSKVVRLSARQFNDFSNLLLPAERLAQQRAGGTWSDLFDYDWIQNRYPVLGLLLWYLFIFVLGLALYPLVRLAMPGLADKGYPLSRALGLVLFGYIAWIAGSAGISYTRITIAIIFGLLVLIGAFLAYYQRAELREEWKNNRKYFVMIEGLFLAFFLIDLVIRLGNPDLWHPAKGGERPMDFSYFNAIIKSTSFPPYDPWFAGGYINYYYYGFVLVATPVKLLGIVPTIAYNFILPTLFAIVGICAFSIGWNLLANNDSLSQDDRAEAEGESSTLTIHAKRSALLPGSGQAFIGGLAASALTLLLGNLGTIQLIYQKLEQLGGAGEFSWDTSISTFQRLMWALQGFILTLKGASLPMGLGEWYWNPSRVIPPGPGNEITEFPLFTFIYSDLHAHMIAMPLALLALSWALSVVMGRARWRNQLSAGLGIVVGGLVIGALYPTNLSDTYTYLLIGLIALGYAIWRYANVSDIATHPDLKRLLLVGASAVALAGLSIWLYQPYRAWYSQAYSALDPWNGPFTPIWSYLTHWTVMLFIVVSWMAWETREWMASTPVSSLRKLKPYQLLIEGALVLIVLAMLVLAYRKISVGWIALPIAAWAGVLLLRPSMPDAKRFVLFLIGTALLVTVVVDLVVVRGDIGRANTIFKFYLQAWLLLAVSAGAAFAWTLSAFFKWLPGWRVFWQTSMILLISGAASFTVSGTAGKIGDRWIVEAPHTLDSMTFMNYAYYDDFGQRMDLSEDYRAIRWMQDNIQGSPVIVEANCPEYRWCTRFTIYTGLPGVIGWNFHQRQQRAFLANWVEDRVVEIGNFYNSIDIEFTRTFLKTYDVRYIIVGQLERAEYIPEGIAKFERFDGTYWRAVYSDTNTVIYEVLP